jgi:hypothetical protein
LVVKAELSAVSSTPGLKDTFQVPAQEARLDDPAQAAGEGASAASATTTKAIRTHLILRPPTAFRPRLGLVNSRIGYCCRRR